MDDVYSWPTVRHRYWVCWDGEAIGCYGAGEKEAGAVKEKMSFRAWEKLMQEIPGFTREAKGTAGQTLDFNHETGKTEWLSPAQVSMQKALDHLKQAEVNFNRAGPEYVDVAVFELRAAEERVRIAVREAKHEI